MSLKFHIDVNTSNEEFDRIYPDFIQERSKIFWTPLHIAKRAAELLVDNKNTKVLDIGSGVGKFCLIGATHTKGIFHGMEQREHLVELCNDIVKTYKVERVKFIHNNIIYSDFSNYNAFYLYNPFYENLYHADKLDDFIVHKQNHYTVYNQHVKAQFDALPVGTKIVTYHGYHEEIPLSYQAVKKEYDNKLILWIKSEADESLFFKEKLLNTCVTNLKKDGFINVNCQNIQIDPMLRHFSEKIILSKIGIHPVLDSIIEDLLNTL